MNERVPKLGNTRYLKERNLLKRLREVKRGKGYMFEPKEVNPFFDESAIKMAIANTTAGIMTRREKQTELAIITPIRPDLNIE